MANGGGSAAPMPVGGIEGTVRIDTSNVASDLQAVLQALQTVDAVLNKVSGNSASNFASAFQQAASSTASASSAADTFTSAVSAGIAPARQWADSVQAMSDATDAITAGIAPASAAVGMVGSAAAAASGPAHQFADAIQAMSDATDALMAGIAPMSAAVGMVGSALPTATSAFANYASSSLDSAKATSAFNGMMGNAASPIFGFADGLGQAASNARMFANQVNDAHAAVIPFADDATFGAQQAGQAWGQTRTVLQGLTDNQMTAAARGSRELGEKMYHGAGKATGGFRQFNYQISTAAFLFDDLQYVGEQGLRPILNNLVMIHPALGAVAIAGNLVYTNWDKLTGLFREGQTQSEAERMAELAKNTHKTAEAEKELAEYKERRNRAEAASKITSEDDDLRKKGVEAAVKKAGGGPAVVGAIAASFRRDANGVVPEAEGANSLNAAQAEYDSWKSWLDDMVAKGKVINANTLEHIQEVGEKLKQAKRDHEIGIEQKAQEILADAISSDKGYKVLQSALDRHADKFPESFSQDFKAASPEAQKTQKSQVEGLKQWGKQLEKEAKEKDKAFKEEKRLGDKNDLAEINAIEFLAKEEEKGIKKIAAAQAKADKQVEAARLASMTARQRALYRKNKARNLLARNGEGQGIGGAPGPMGIGAAAARPAGMATRMPRRRRRLSTKERLQIAAEKRKAKGLPPIAKKKGMKNAVPNLDVNRNLELNQVRPSLDLNTKLPPLKVKPLNIEPGSLAGGGKADVAQILERIDQKMGETRDASKGTEKAIATLAKDATRDWG